VQVRPLVPSRKSLIDVRHSSIGINRSQSYVLKQVPRIVETYACTDHRRVDVALTFQGQTRAETCATDKLNASETPRAAITAGAKAQESERRIDRWSDQGVRVFSCSTHELNRK
jgi:hypothetical protein